MTTKTRRAFTDEFKAGTVTLLESSRRPLAQIAAELGIEPSVLRNWRRKLRPGVAPAMAAVGMIATSVPTADLVTTTVPAQTDPTGLCFFIATSLLKVLRRPFESAQYAATDYRKALTKMGAICSMSRKGNCWDNAPMQSYFKTLKAEAVWRSTYATRQDARRDVFAFIETFYHRRRVHSAIG